MKTKEIENTQTKLREGLNKAANIITSSMGASGSTVIITKNTGELLITKDGVSIAKSIDLPDPIENIGAKLLISAASETVASCGDGTTLTSLLLQQMVNNTKTVQDYNELYEEAQLLKEYILSKSKEVTTTEEIYNIAKTSANSTYVGNLIKEIYDNTSFNTHIELESTDEKDTTITVHKGYKFDSGFHKAWQSTSKFKQEVAFDNPTFYLSQEPLHTVTERIKKLVTLGMENDVPIVFVAEKYSREFDSFIQHQVIRGGAKIMTLKLPNFGEGREHEYNNLKAFLSNSHTATKIVSNPYYSIITNDDQPNLEQRTEELLSLSQNTIDPLEARQFKKMYHQLSGNIATIWVGGNTKEEVKELYDRVEDAIGATSTAIDQGYVLGAGACMLNFKGEKYKSIWSSPSNKIKANAGLGITNVNVDLIDYPLEYVGTDLKTGQPINLMEHGIIDPTNTLITAIDNALSTTKLVLNTKYMLYNEL